MYICFFSTTPPLSLSLSLVAGDRVQVRVAICISLHERGFILSCDIKRQTILSSRHSTPVCVQLPSVGFTSLILQSICFLLSELFLSVVSISCFFFFLFNSFFLSSFLPFFLSFLLSFFLSFLLSFFLSFLLSFFLSFLLSFFLSFLLSFFLSFLLSFFLSFLLPFFLSFLLSFCLSLSLDYPFSKFLFSFDQSFFDQPTVQEANR
ncbi:unnamed protein product [Acanthosepion pharaonis]|uniref:Uncharacterized protein n=1 Tax=Acanthosepion pharaonis TaxID=158019 RepID=A0A812AKP5_ACAPH|nr:unnamed protein product [Sepia pharaonis]